MDNRRTQTNPSLDWDAMCPESERELLHLVTAWSREEPHRIGEAAPIKGPCLLGSGAPQPVLAAGVRLRHTQRGDSLRGAIDAELFGNAAGYRYLKPWTIQKLIV